MNSILLHVSRTIHHYIKMKIILYSKALSLSLLQEKCLLSTKNFLRTQKALAKNPISDGKIKPLQILGKM